MTLRTDRPIIAQECTPYPLGELPGLHDRANPVVGEALKGFALVSKEYRVSGVGRLLAALRAGRRGWT
eukprot:10135347-Heterocapsa_arctica.AAC.1